MVTRLREWWRRVRCPHCCWETTTRREYCAHGRILASWTEIRCRECDELGASFHG